MDLRTLLAGVPADALGHDTLDALVREAAARRDDATLTRLAPVVALDSAAAGVITGIRSAQVRAAWIARPDLPAAERETLLADENRVSVLRAAGRDIPRPRPSKATRTDDPLASYRAACRADVQALVAALQDSAASDRQIDSLLARLTAHRNSRLGHERALAIAGEVFADTDPASVSSALGATLTRGGGPSWDTMSGLIGALPVDHMIALLRIGSSVEIVLNQMRVRWPQQYQSILADAITDTATRDRLIKEASGYLPVEWLHEYGRRNLITEPACVDLLPSPAEEPELWETLMDQIAAAHPTLFTPTPAQGTRDWMQALAQAWAHPAMPDALAVAIGVALPTSIIEDFAYVWDYTDIARTGMLGAIAQHDSWTPEQVDAWWSALNAAVADNASDGDVIRSCIPIALHPRFVIPPTSSHGLKAWITGLPVDQLSDWPATLVLKGMAHNPEVAIEAARMLEQLIADCGPNAGTTLAGLADTFPGTWGQLHAAARHAGH